MDDLYPDRPRAASEYAERRRQRLEQRARAARLARRKRATGLGVAAGVMVAVLALGWFAVAMTVSARAASEASGLLDDADRIVTQVDAAIYSRDESAGAEAARGIAERVPAARTLLGRSVAALEPVSPRLTLVWRRPVRLEQAAEARLAMLEPAPSLLEVAAQSTSAAPLAQQGWRSLQDALAEASATIPPDDASTARLTKARRAAENLGSDLTLARERFAAAEAAFPDASFEEYVVYIDQLMRSNRAALLASTALLEGRTAVARSQLKSRKDRAAQAAELAEGLPASVAAAIDEGVRSAVGSRIAIYEAARDKARQADEGLGRSGLQPSP